MKRVSLNIMENKSDDNSLMRLPAQPLISVVMPVYNVEAYVNEAIQSILDQTFPDFEFIIVDDASTDKTWDIVSAFKDRRVICLRNAQNKGNYFSRNRGMKQAKGKYIAVMDGDDIAMPERLEKEFNYLEENPDMLAVGTDFRFTLEQEKPEMPTSYEEVCISLLRGFSLLHPSLMMRTEIIRSLGGYNENYRYAADYNLFCQLSLKGKVNILPEQLMTYRLHPNQISKTFTSEQNEYANDIRKNYQIAFCNKYKQEGQAEISFSEIGIAEMGRAICLYTYARYTKSAHYEEMADQLLDIVYKLTTKKLPVDKEKGLYGLGCGLLYLLRNNFVEGNEDEVLEEIDHIIVDAIRNKEGIDKEKLLHYIQCRNLAV